MTRDLGNINALEIAVKTDFHAQHGTKTTPVFLPADGEVSWVVSSKFGLLTIMQHCNQKIPMPVS